MQLAEGTLVTQLWHAEHRCPLALRLGGALMALAILVRLFLLQSGVPQGGMRSQRRIRRRAWELGGGA